MMPVRGGLDVGRPVQTEALRPASGASRRVPARSRQRPARPGASRRALVHVPAHPCVPARHPGNLRDNSWEPIASGKVVKVVAKSSLSRRKVVAKSSVPQNLGALKPHVYLLTSLIIVTLLILLIL